MKYVYFTFTTSNVETFYLKAAHAMQTGLFSSCLVKVITKQFGQLSRNRKSHVCCN